MHLNVKINIINLAGEKKKIGKCLLDKLTQHCKASVFQYIFFKGEENVYVPVESRYFFYRAQIELIIKKQI